MYHELTVNNVFLVVSCSSLDYELSGSRAARFFSRVLFRVSLDGLSKKVTNRSLAVHLQKKKHF